MAGQEERARCLDWLRVLAFFAMVPYHVSLIFTTHAWFVTDREQSAELASLMRVLNYFRVPLLFFISGFVLAKVLARRSALVVLKERYLRLGVPLAFGVAVVVPLQRYLGWLARGRPPGGDLLVWSFSPASYFPRNFVWHHLWFLAYLLLATTLVVPASTLIPWERLRAALGTKRILAGLVGVLVAVDLAFDGHLPSSHNLYRDWANLFTSLAFFAAGFALSAGPWPGSFWDDVDRLKWPALVVAVAATAWLDGFPPFPARSAYSDFEFVALRAIRVANVLAWLTLLLGFSRRYLRRGGRFLSYCNEAVLPCYVLHQTVIVAVGYACRSADLPVWPKFLLEVVLSLAITAFLYEVAIRRWPFVRFLFGQKPLEASRVARMPVGNAA